MMMSKSEKPYPLQLEPALIEAALIAPTVLFGLEFSGGRWISRLSESPTICAGLEVTARVQAQHGGYLPATYFGDLYIYRGACARRCGPRRNWEGTNRGYPW